MGKVLLFTIKMNLIFFGIKINTSKTTSQLNLMEYNFILENDFDLIIIKKSVRIIFVENVGQDLEQLCLEEEQYEELLNYYSDYDTW